MKDGAIDCVGTYDELKRGGVNFAAVIEAHRVQNRAAATEAAGYV